MADLMQAGAVYQAAQLKAFAGRAVTYQRGGSQVSVTATVGRVLLKFGDELGGQHVQMTDRDYIVTAADLVLNGAVVTPETGDQFLDLDGGLTPNVYEVQPYGTEPHYRPADPFGVMLRIHTKFLGPVGS